VVKTTCTRKHKKKKKSNMKHKINIIMTQKKMKIKTYPTKECYQLSTRKAPNSNLQNPKEGSSSSNNTKGDTSTTTLQKKQ
jgi:hypothetical protein